MNALAITDSGNVSGVPEFYDACIRSGIKPIIGLGFYFADDSRFSQSTQKYHLVLLAENSIGFMHLLALAERSFTQGFYKRPRIDFELLETYHDGLICLTGGLGGLVDKYLYAQRKREAHGNNPLYGDGYYFKSPEEMSSLFSMVPHAVQVSRTIADKCTVLLDVDKCSKISRPDDDLSIIRQLQGCITQQ